MSISEKNRCFVNCAGVDVTFQTVPMASRCFRRRVTTGDGDC